MLTTALIDKALEVNEDIAECLEDFLYKYDPNRTGEYMGEKVQHISLNRRANEHNVIDEVNILTIDPSILEDVIDSFEMHYQAEHQFEEFDKTKGHYTTHAIFTDKYNVNPNLWIQIYGYTKGMVMVSEMATTSIYRAEEP